MSQKQEIACHMIRIFAVLIFRVCNSLNRLLQGILRVYSIYVRIFAVLHALVHCSQVPLYTYGVNTTHAILGYTTYTRSVNTNVIIVFIIRLTHAIVTRNLWSVTTRLRGQRSEPEGEDGYCKP